MGITKTTRHNELRGRLTEYSNFVSQKLQPQLRDVVEARETTEAEISEYIQLQDKIRQIETVVEAEAPSSPLDVVADIAHASVFCNTRIPNPRIIFMNIGFGFHVEMKLKEASQFIGKRIRYLKEDVLKHHSEAKNRLEVDLASALELIEELEENFDDLEEPPK